MNVQNILKRTALSALMFSAVAAPAVTNADSSSKAETSAVNTLAAIVVPAKDSNNVQGIMITKISDPLALAQKYAPETAEDWKKTLEQFRKTFASEMTKDIVVSKAESLKDASGEQTGQLSFSTAAVKTIPAEKLTFNAEKIKDITGEKTGEYAVAVPTTGEKTTPAEKLTISMATVKDIAGVKTDRYEMAIPAASLTDSKNKTEQASIAVSISSTEAKEADTPFAKAWAALSDAEESNNADAIKKALAELLEQYKQQIAEKEAAAK
ncbi:hypothetical protein J23TS9_36340 [Paenibacillus sp. J23TS9]|uniref:hypothetical protein n=1 Tax=Paenibacillus sp. J23TS9 TaxID=2807193 RepID=UPI001B18D5B5|nr:hypothetical protein [Paenibacillus sp. J23TS9]GIP28504.1 hypothetical protein J23TS9_36340 [Paenibacillus sp. J23TS9]